MLGGYQIIDLRKIGLELKSTQQTISDTEILKQLRGLRDYIEKSHDYTKALNNSLKPILIRYRDAKNNEKKEVTSFASIVNENSSLTFTIIAKHLEIEVVFEEKTDDDGNKYYDIKTAKYLYSENEQVEGDLSVEGDSNLKGDVDIDGDVGIDGDAFVGGDLSVTGSINGEENPSVKPIYYHPCYLRADNGEAGGDNREVRISCMILNNDATPFTKDTFIAYIKNLMDNGALINTDGYIQTGANTYGTLVLMRKSGENYGLLFFNDSTGMSSVVLDTYTVHTTEFIDGVNKIN